MGRSICRIEECEKCSLSERMSFLFENYPILEAMMQNYRDDLIDEVMEQKASNQHSDYEELGVRIQVAFCRMSDPTANKGTNRSVISKAIDEGYLDEDFFEGTDDREGLIRKVTSYHIVKESYQKLLKKLNEMDPRDKSIMLPYLLKEKTISMIADELQIEYKSVVQKIGRIKKRMEAGMRLKTD